MQTEQNQFNCAITDIDGISYPTSPKYALQDICTCIFVEDDSRTPFYLFTQAQTPANTKARKKTYGADLAAYITRNKLGSVVRTEKRKNINSGNNVVAFLWTINYEATKSWFKKNLPDEVVVSKLGYFEYR